MTPEQRKSHEDISKKKKNLLNMMNLQTTGQKVTMEMIQNIALSWIELADNDGNGELDFNEFQDFFNNLDGMVYTEDEIK